MKTNQTAIGMLRQWLNEDRIDDPKKMVTNEQIEMWLALDPLKEEEGECRIKSCTGDSECLEHCPCDCHQEKETEYNPFEVTEEKVREAAEKGAKDQNEKYGKETPKKLPSELIRMYGGIKHDFMLDGFEDNTDIRVMNHAIDEMSKRLKGVVMYLDETVMGKTVGCNECGNNIKL